MKNLRGSAKAFIVLSLLSAPAITVAEENVIVVEALGFQLPSNTLLEPGGDPVDWPSLGSLLTLMGDGPVTLLPGRGVELEIGISENSDYATSINNLSALEWLTFQTQMLQQQIVDVRNRSDRAAAMATGDRLADRHRVLIARSSWYEDEELQNLLAYDVFYGTKYIGFTFSWAGPEGGEAERLVDEIATSIRMTDPREGSRSEP